ncbi:hypothetical protein [Kitasatospora sp. NPDC088351]|uniref:hypothetical protein n=1 Tax=unclassified Kitasatospora TaxID=2633591 RepID=UPI003440A6B1
MSTVSASSGEPGQDRCAFVRHLFPRPGSAVSTRVSLDFGCPRMAAADSVVNVYAGQSVPEPTPEDPELIISQTIPALVPGQRLLHEDETPGNGLCDVASVSGPIARLYCEAGKEGCRDRDL